MAYPVQGRDVLLEVYSDVADDYVFFTCAESVAISFEPEKVNLTTVGLGRGFADKERRRGYAINLTGVSDILSDGRTIFTMTDPDNINAVYQIRLSFEDSLGNTAVYTCNANLDAANINAVVSDLSDYDLTLRVIGTLTLLQTIGGIPGGGSLYTILSEGGDDMVLETGDEILQENG